MEKHNRKSHLAPQLSPSTKALLRGEDNLSSIQESSNAKTPTSGDIPIVGCESGNDSFGHLMISAPTNGASSSPQLQQGQQQGSGMIPQMANLSLHQGHPPRTSSANAIPNMSRGSLSGSSLGGGMNPPTTTLPMRPAPPPGPLPAPPGSLQSTLRQQQQQPLYQNAADHEYRESQRRAHHAAQNPPSMYGGGYLKGDSPPY